jgi:hypothetical protein
VAVAVTVPQQRKAFPAELCEEHRKVRDDHEREAGERQRRNLRAEPFNREPSGLGKRQSQLSDSMRGGSARSSSSVCIALSTACRFIARRAPRPLRTALDLPQAPPRSAALGEFVRRSPSRALVWRIPRSWPAFLGLHFGSAHDEDGRAAPAAGVVRCTWIGLDWAAMGRPNGLGDRCRHAIQIQGSITGARS